MSDKYNNDSENPFTAESETDQSVLKDAGEDTSFEMSTQGTSPDHLQEGPEEKAPEGPERGEETDQALGNVDADTPEAGDNRQETAPWEKTETAAEPEQKEEPQAAEDSMDGAGQESTKGTGSDTAEAEGTAPEEKQENGTAPQPGEHDFDDEPKFDTQTGPCS